MSVMEAAAKKMILRIELWHGILLTVLLVVFGRGSFLDPTALIAGGVFMGVNFLLLAYGIAWILRPLAGKGRVKTGVGLLILKIAVFLGLLSTLFFRFNLDAVSFAAGFSTLIIAIVLETIRATVKVGTSSNGTPV
jgi:Kef-type K+ transport system membrane component KefB